MLTIWSFGNYKVILLVQTVVLYTYFISTGVYSELDLDILDNEDTVEDSFLKPLNVNDLTDEDSGENQPYDIKAACTSRNLLTKTNSKVQTHKRTKSKSKYYFAFVSEWWLKQKDVTIIMENIILLKGK